MTRSYTRTFARGEKKKIIDNYLNLRHQHRFLWEMIEKVNSGIELEEAMKTFGYVNSTSLVASVSTEHPAEETA